MRKNNYIRFTDNQATINITPLLDVLLVLLVIFMMTAQAINNRIDVDLPKAHSSANQGREKVESLRIYINNKQEILINDKKIDNLEGYLSSLPQDAHQGEEIILSGDQNIPYQKIIELLVVLNNFGFNKVKMAYQDQ